MARAKLSVDAGDREDDETFFGLAAIPLGYTKRGVAVSPNEILSRVHFLHPSSPGTLYVVTSTWFVDRRLKMQ